MSLEISTNSYFGSVSIPAYCFTYFSKFTLKANCREVRTTVIIPYEKNEDIDKIAKSVQFKTETSKSQATLTWGKTTYSIIINDNQVWSVDRINSK